MDITPQGHIRVIAMLDGKELETIIDTGSPATLIGERTATSKLNVDSSTATLTLHGASGGSTAATVQHFHILQLGNVTIDDPSLLVTKDETAWRSDYSDLLIGLNELSKFHVYIAYRERKLYLSLATATR
jgi:predicted aspartyl protease